MKQNWMKEYPPRRSQIGKHRKRVNADNLQESKCTETCARINGEHFFFLMGISKGYLFRRK